MALAGTSSSCKVCTHEHWQDYDYFTKSFRILNKLQQTKLESFPCPIMLQRGVNCSGPGAPLYALTTMFST